MHNMCAYMHSGGGGGGGVSMAVVYSESPLICHNCKCQFYGGLAGLVDYTGGGVERFHCSCVVVVVV